MSLYTQNAFNTVWQGPWWASDLDSILPMQEAKGSTLVRELRSYIPYDVIKKKDSTIEKTVSDYNQLRGFPSGSVMKNLPAM